MADKRYLITGAGTGLGKGVALGLAQLGLDVIAGVETAMEVPALIKEAEYQRINLRVEKLDIKDPEDRERAAGWDIDVLVNNAGISLGGAIIDVPEQFLREQFEVNVFGTILLTQSILRRMAGKGSGRIIFVSSVHGLIADPFSGPYCASKHAIEAFGESLAREMQELGIEVQMINPGPYLTGLNDREYEAWREWDVKPEERLFNYEELAFPYEQLDPEGCIEEMIAIIRGESKDYRNVIPKALVSVAKKRRSDLWDRKIDKDLGERDTMVESALTLDPATKPAEGIAKRIKEKFT